MAAPMTTMASDVENIILRLYEIQAVKFGEFKLKSGILSPVYFDLRVVISYPDLMADVSDLLWKAAETSSQRFDSVCGVPYTALPLATCISTKYNKPMLIRRKEAKDYGTKKIIEGHFKEGENCLIVEDVVTSGSSVLETVKVLENEKIAVTHAVVLMDRLQGGKERLEDTGVHLSSVCTIMDVLRVLESKSKLTAETVRRVKDFITENNTYKPPGKGQGDVEAKKVLPYGARSELCSHSVTKTLFAIMEKKKTNLCVSADLTKCSQVLELADLVGPHICMIKTHIDILDDFSHKFITELTNIANKHEFLIFEDRKFADIGNTVFHQYTGGLYKIADWANIVNAHILPGEGIIQGLKKSVSAKARGCLLIAEMSSAGSLATGTYTAQSIKIAENNKDFIMGFICQSKLSDDPTLLHMTPGVKLTEGSDNLGQQYLTPREVIYNKKSDIIIVGRGIISSHNQLDATIKYKEAGYNAYEELISGAQSS